MKQQVLVVEDSEDIRVLLEYLLTNEGIPVVTAKNGKEGIERLREMTNPGLVLLDLMMPVMTGEKFLDAKALEPRIAKVPVVILSAATDRRQLVHSEGVVGFLRKPVNIDHVLSVVQDHCPSASSVESSAAATIA